MRIVTLHFSSRIKLSVEKKKTPLRRGRINDANGDILAISIESDSLYANPELIEDTKKVAKTLSEMLQMDEKRILSRLNQKKRFVWIKRKLPDIAAARIRSLKIKGLGFKKEFKRVYPHETLAAHILGFTDIDNNGLAGVEYKYDRYLKGDTDVENIDKDSFTYGMNINLTIDRYIQHTAEKYLALTIEKNGAKKGAVLVSDVRNGKILAFGIYPSYNPNYYFRYSAEQRKVYSVVEPFEPGSTMKIFSAAAWLTGGKANLDRTYHGNGEITLYDTTIRSTHVNGWINMHDAIRLSDNVAVIRAMMEVGSSHFYDMLTNFGFGKQVCKDFPGESPGILRTVDKWSGISKSSISIGQEISANIFQLAAAYGAIANGGIYIEPSLIDSIEMESGHKLQKFYPKSRGRIYNREKAEVLRTMLESVVDSGTGTAAAVTGYKVAGKTGTAQKSSPLGGYYEGRYTASFCGFAPYDNPRVVIIVVVDEPQVLLHGGEVAAPVFADIAGDILPYLGEGVTPLKASQLQAKQFQAPYFDGKHMPNLIGRDLADVSAALLQIQKKYAVSYQFSGKGRVVKQSPQAGSVLREKNSIILHFR